MRIILEKSAVEKNRKIFDFEWKDDELVSRSFLDSTTDKWAHKCAHIDANVENRECLIPSGVPRLIQVTDLEVSKRREVILEFF